MEQVKNKDYGENNSLTIQGYFSFKCNDTNHDNIRMNWGHFSHGYQQTPDIRTDNKKSSARTIIRRWDTLTAN